MDASIRGRRRRGQLSALLLAVLVLVLPATAGAVPVWLTKEAPIFRVADMTSVTSWTPGRRLTLSLATSSVSAAKPPGIE